MLSLFQTFFKIGLTAFGGPLAHIAVIEREIIDKQKLISKDDFIDFIGSVNLIPGPNSTQIVLLCGYVHKGILGMLAAGIGFILPAATITLILAIIYSNPQQIPFLNESFHFLKYGIFPIIIFSLISFTKKITASGTSLMIFLITGTLSYFWDQEILIIISFGLIGWLVQTIKTKHKSYEFLSLIIFAKFLKIGFTLFGGGMILIAYINSEFVQSELLSNSQLLDAIAFGQFTPGPILTSATFIGYQINGISGAIVATLGIFLPSFFLIPFLSRFLLDKENMAPLLTSVNAACIGIMTSVTLKIAFQLADNLYGLPLLFTSLIMSYKKISTIFIVVISILYGILFQIIFSQGSI